MLQISLPVVAERLLLATHLCCVATVCQLLDCSSPVHECTTRCATVSETFSRIAYGPTPLRSHMHVKCQAMIPPSDPHVRWKPEKDWGVVAMLIIPHTLAPPVPTPHAAPEHICYTATCLLCCRIIYASGAMMALTSAAGGADGVFRSWHCHLDSPLYAVTAVAEAAAQSAPNAVSTSAQEANTWASDTGPLSLPMTHNRRLTAPPISFSLGASDSLHIPVEVRMVCSTCAYNASWTHSMDATAL